MELEISRASEKLHVLLINQKPCQNAVFKNGAWYLEIETLDDLASLQKEVVHELIINLNTNNIIIYDDHLE